MLTTKFTFFEEKLNEYSVAILTITTTYVATNTTKIILRNKTTNKLAIAIKAKNITRVTAILTAEFTFSEEKLNYEYITTKLTAILAAKLTAILAATLTTTLTATLTATLEATLAAKLTARITARITFSERKLNL
jgi:hypothetical protein